MIICNKFWNRRFDRTFIIDIHGYGQGRNFAPFGLFGAETFERRQLALKVGELQTSFHPVRLGQPVRIELGLSPDSISKKISVSRRRSNIGAPCARINDKILI